MHQLVIKEGSVLLMHGVTMKFNQCICLDSNKLTVKFCAVGIRGPRRAAATLERKKTVNCVLDTWHGN